MSVKYKIVFSDIDGTLLNSQHQISANTKQAIQRIVAKGIPFILVSARPPSAMTVYTQQLNSDLLISYGGALILDEQSAPIYSVTLTEADLAKLNEKLTACGALSVNYYSYYQWFANDLKSPWVINESQITQLQPQQTPKELPPIHKMLLMGEAATIETLEKQLQTEFPHLYIHRSKATYLEVMNQQASKANAVRFIHRQLNIKQEETVAFGDNFNDLDMLEYAGLGVAMANAPLEIQQRADYVTASNDEEGIAQVLNLLFNDESDD